MNQQLSVLPLPKDYLSTFSIRAVSWLLKTVAIELKALSSTRQRSLISRMTTLLLDGRSHAGAASGTGQVVTSPLGFCSYSIALNGFQALTWNSFIFFL